MSPTPTPGQPVEREAGAGHTPGPWTTGAPYGMHGVEVVGDDGNRKVCGVIAVDRDQYDKSGRKLADVPDAEGWANARLIAACPRMYDYIKGRADAGDAEASAILAEVSNA